MSGSKLMGAGRRIEATRGLDPKAAAAAVVSAMGAAAKQSTTMRCKPHEAWWPSKCEEHDEHPGEMRGPFWLAQGRSAPQLPLSIHLPVCCLCLSSPEQRAAFALMVQTALQMAQRRMTRMLYVRQVKCSTAAAAASLAAAAAAASEPTRDSEGLPHCVHPLHLALHQRGAPFHRSRQQRFCQQPWVHLCCGRLAAHHLQGHCQALDMLHPFHLWSDRKAAAGKRM